MLTEKKVVPLIHSCAINTVCVCGMRERECVKWNDMEDDFNRFYMLLLKCLYLTQAYGK